jgi:hypothetical protein
MDIINLTIGLIFIFSGIAIIVIYQRLIKKHGYGGFSFKLKTGGIGFVILGLYLIITELI